MHAGISLSENDQFFAQTVWSGIVLEVVKPAVQVTSQTPVFVDLEIDETSITSITNISDA